MPRNLSQERVDFLSKNLDTLEQDRDTHLRLGGREIRNGHLTDLQTKVLASLYGVFPEGCDEEIQGWAFRWLLANTFQSRTAYRPHILQKQWRNIMQYYFAKSHGIYAELVLAERLLIFLKRKKSGSKLLSDIFLADRFADYHLMCDAILHLCLLGGNIRMGVQFTTLSASKKIHDLLIHRDHLHDRGVYMDGVLDLFCRYHTIVLGFPRFHEIRYELRRKDLGAVLDGSTRFRAEHIIQRGNERFRHYHEQVSILLHFLHIGIIDGRIRPGKKVGYHESDSPTVGDTGETISYRIFERGGEWFVVIKILEPPVNTSRFGYKPKIIQYNPVELAMLLDPEFLELYKDMARGDLLSFGDALSV